LTRCVRVAEHPINPEKSGRRQIAIGEKIFREGDRVIQTRNNYDLGVFNGDIGRLEAIDPEDYSCRICFSSDGQTVRYQKEDLTEIALAYAVTIHKSQGSEFEAVIIPVMPQHFKMLFRNLIYTGLTRAKKLAVFVGSRKALAMAVRMIDSRKRQTALSSLVSKG
jgi:exodeoxyribonuclease V alpha subunit